MSEIRTATYDRPITPVRTCHCGREVTQTGGSCLTCSNLMAHTHRRRKPGDGDALPPGHWVTVAGIKRYVAVTLADIDARIEKQIAAYAAARVGQCHDCGGPARSEKSKRCDACWMENKKERMAMVGKKCADCGKELGDRRAQRCRSCAASADHAMRRGRAA